MDQVIAVLKTNPHNYFHYVVNDIIGLINEYLSSPILRSILDQIIHEVIGPKISVEYIDESKVQYDFQWLLYHHVGIGPSDWMYRNNVEITLNEQAQFIETSTVECNALINLMIHLTNQMFPDGLADEPYEKLSDIVTDFLRYEATNTSEYLAFKQQMDGTPAGLAYRQKHGEGKYVFISWQKP